ncbi:MAG: bifunctional transaldolase/phosoglucose isomerase [bacterium]|nr:MAG: bifunctional transaldolase/phosoglucose isomerase [bacterium]
MNNIQKAHKLGQSIWLDYIRRSFITSGELNDLLDKGLTGMTSNPSIFEKAIAGSSDYDADLNRMIRSGMPVEEIYDTLTRDDIAMAGDALRPVFDSTGGSDGFVSLEVNPLLATDTASTIAEGRRLFRALGRPNIMIKVPATVKGIPAIEVLLSEGINVNVTLIFSLDQYRAAAEAYIRGLERIVSAGGDVGGVASVASFFVSRLDTVVDEVLQETGFSEHQGMTAIANAKVAYAEFSRIFSGPRWEKMAAKGARVQRPLWASTSTKNPRYPDTLYVDSLIGKDTVNTLPTNTLHAFLDHGQVKSTIDEGVDAAAGFLDRIAGLGIDLDGITDDLLTRGVDLFSRSFQSLMSSIRAKGEELMEHRVHFDIDPGPYAEAVGEASRGLRERNIMSRIWDHDHTVWKPSPDEITNRLGWLASPENMAGVLPEIQDFAARVREDGYTHALLLGMGGSSLAPLVFGETFPVSDGYLDLSVLDSTDPAAVMEMDGRHDPRRTLFIVSTKSGGTVETLSFFKYFYNRARETVGDREAGRHFAAITDPGSSLERLAREHGFRRTFLNDPNIGGRYSALSYFGLVPAALLGLDLPTLLDRAATMACNCEAANCPVQGDNTGGQLGAAMGRLSLEGVDKLTIVTSPGISTFGTWLEQLVAESTGKEGKGILPVDGEPVGQPDVYGGDRFFVTLRLPGDEADVAAVQSLADSGRPFVRIDLKDAYDLGGEFFRWEMATAVAGSIMGINPFDQPNVESAKVQARRMLDEFVESGSLPSPPPTLEEDGILVYSDLNPANLDEAVNGFLDQAEPGSYVALQAYVHPSNGNGAALADLRVRIRDALKVATTSGFGPRFLHSTGQLHKGDGGKGLFIQITTEDALDLPIPDVPGEEKSSVSFGVLKAAQAMGDRRALLDAGRRVARFHITGDARAGIRRLAETVKRRE